MAADREMAAGRPLERSIGTLMTIAENIARIRGLRLIRDAGVDARTEREETEDEIVLTLRIPKQRRKEA